MNEITRVAIDTSKSVFTLHAVDARDQPVLRRNLRRKDLVPFFAKLPPVTVSMEACGGSHLGPYASGPGPSGAVDPGAICQAVRQTQQE